jgi:hypothetical protein
MLFERGRERMLLAEEVTEKSAEEMWGAGCRRYFTDLCFRRRLLGMGTPSSFSRGARTPLCCDVVGARLLHLIAHGRHSSTCSTDARKSQGTGGGALRAMP